MQMPIMPKFSYLFSIVKFFSDTNSYCVPRCYISQSRQRIQDTDTVSFTVVSDEQFGAK